MSFPLRGNLENLRNLSIVIAPDLYIYVTKRNNRRLMSFNHSRKQPLIPLCYGQDDVCVFPFVDFFNDELGAVHLFFVQ